MRAAPPARDGHGLARGPARPVFAGLLLATGLAAVGALACRNTNADSVPGHRPGPVMVPAGDASAGKGAARSTLNGAASADGGAAAAEAKQGTGDGAGADEQAPPAQFKPETEAPGVDLSRLEPDEKKTFFRIINKEACLCGEAHSVANCLKVHAPCRRSQWAAKLVAKRLRQGVPEDEITTELVERYRPKKPVTIDVAAAPRKGPADAPVTIVEFSDFECPACKRMAPILGKVVAESGGKVRLFYKHYPLRMHMHAQGAAQAAVAAQKQGKFWKMHDRLFANQSSLTEPDLMSYASDLGLDLARFKGDLHSDNTKAQVQKDRNEGEGLKIRATPTLFINGRLYAGPLDFDEIKAYIDEELANR